MSNERIEQILEENHIPIDSMTSKMGELLLSTVRKSMQQYGAEQYQKGRMDQEKVENFKLGLQSDELRRLCELVKAQKELIEMYKGEPPHMLHDGKRYLELINQIKSLEA